jgi:hypothetical protein
VLENLGGGERIMNKLASGGDLGMGEEEASHAGAGSHEIANKQSR